MKRENNLWLALVAIVVLAVGAMALMSRDRPGSGSVANCPVAPAFTTKTVDGKAVSLSDYKGKVLLLDFWATWCPPCREEVPNVVDAYNRFHGQGFDVLGISLDQEKPALQSFTKEHGMAWPQVFDADSGNALAQKFNVEAIPTMLLIDGDTGRILARDPRGSALAPAVEAALKDR